MFFAKSRETVCEQGMSRDSRRFHIGATMKSRIMGTKEKRAADNVQLSSNGKLLSSTVEDGMRRKGSAKVIKLSASGSTKAVDIHI